uniref:A1 homeodomain mating type protein n=1 Tax=Heterobasidion annosum TaxID=13563 RepID=S5REX8_HETAN|nr:a1 homeodomain mating type protein [Heterobasidion annosum]
MVSIVDSIPMSPMDDSTIQRRLLRTEHNLLDAVARGNPQALKSFYESWASLGRDIEYASRSRNLGSDTHSLVKVVTARIGVLAEAFLDTYLHVDSLTDDLMSELSDTLTQFGLSEDPSIPVTPDHPHHPKKIQLLTDFATSRPPSYAEAYDWLLDNLHNPYPSPDIKSHLAQAHGISSKAIGAWFKQVRQEIGWSTLSGEIFSGSRSKTTRAASLAYISRDPDLPGNVMHAFRVVRDKLERLPISSRTPGKDTGSADAETLQKLESMRNQVVDGASVREEIDREIEHLRGKGKEAEPSPPSPLPLPDTLLSGPASPFTPDTSDEEEDTTPPPPVAGCKRRLDSATETSSDSFRVSSDRPTKRSRTDKTNPISSSELPQPRLSHNLPSPIPEPTPLPSSPTPTLHLSQSNVVETTERPASPVPCISRKRRLSDADLSQLEPKRPRGVIQGPRAYAVSDPLPAGLGGDTLESLLSNEDWAGLFSTNHHTPPDVEPQPLQIVSNDVPIIPTSDPYSSLALVPPAQTPSYPTVNLDDPIFSVSDVLALLSASSPDAATATHPTTPSAVLPNTPALVSENPEAATPQGASSAIDWGHFDEITLEHLPTCEPIAPQGSVAPCLQGIAGSTQSMSLLDDMLLPFMFTPDMNPPPDTFGLDIYSGFEDQSQAWTGLWDLD